MNDKSKSAVDASVYNAQKTVGSLETTVRDMIENQPYTAAGIALGIGWLLGRMHRPF